MKVEFLYFESCANYKQALNLLKKILREKGMESPVELIEIESDAMAKELEFPGSPTIRINGQDIDKTYEAVPGRYGQKCRVYEDNGILKGVPPDSMVRKAIAENIAG